MFLPGLPAEVALVTTQSRAVPLQDGAGEPTLFLGADAWDTPDTNEPSARAFVDTYQGLYGTVPTGGDAVSYDAVRLLFGSRRASG